MKKTVLVLTVLATAVVAAQTLTPEQTLDRRSIGERGAGPEFSPDGSRVVFTVAEPVKSATRARAIWLYELSSGQSRQLTFSGKNDSSPRWAPDGSSIAFLSDRTGSANLFLYDLDSREHYQLTNVVGAVSALTEYSPAISWARQADRLAFTYYENGDYTIWTVNNPRALKKTPYRDRPPTVVSAGSVNQRTITGRITMWAPSRFDEQVAVVQDDQGQRWVVRFGPGTLPAGSAVGTEVTVMGRETVFANELNAVSATLTSSASALPASAASGWAVVPGAVQDASGTTAVIRANGGAVVTVDLSELDADARTWVSPGRGVTVVGVYRADGVLTARGVATNAP